MLRSIIKALAGIALAAHAWPVLHAADTHRGTEAGDEPFTTGDLVGEWISDGCESVRMGEGRDVSHFVRRYVFSFTHYNVRYQFFGDAGCSRPLFTLRISGPYELGAPRPEVGRVREMLVIFDTVHVMADSEAGAAVLNRACKAYTWTEGAIQEVGPSGCLAIKPRAECIGDFELARVEDGYFTPGYRTPNMCTPAGRPTRIQDTRGAQKVH